MPSWTTEGMQPETHWVRETAVSLSRENWNLDSFLSSSVFSRGFHQFCTVHLATPSFILFSPKQIQWNKLSWYLWNVSCYGFISVVVFSLFTSTLPLLMSLAAALLPLMLTSPGHRLYLLHCMHVGTGLYIIVSHSWLLNATVINLIPKCIKRRIPKMR